MADERLVKIALNVDLDALKQGFADAVPLIRAFKTVLDDEVRGAVARFEESLGSLAQKLGDLGDKTKEVGRAARDFVPKPRASERDETENDRGQAGKAQGRAGFDEERAAAEINRLRRLQAEAVRDADERVRLEAMVLERTKELYGEDSTAYIQELKRRQALEKQTIQESLKSGLDAVKAQSAAKRRQIEEERDQGRITNDAARSQLVALTKETLAEDQAILDAAQKRGNGLVQIDQQVAARRADIERRANQTLVLLERQAMQARQKEAVANLQALNKSLAPFEKAFQKTIDGLLSGTLNARAILGSILQDYVRQEIQDDGRLLGNWIKNQVLRTDATVAGVAARTEAEQGAGQQSLLVSAATAIKDIAVKAYQAAAGAFSATAEIPVIGPELAPAAAATALAAVLGFGSSIASAAGGWDRVPSDGMIAQLHKDEMVLPAALADPLRGMLGRLGMQSAQNMGRWGLADRPAISVSSDGGRSGMMGMSPLVFAPQVTAMDARGVDRVLRQHGDRFMDFFRNMQRNGTAKGRS